MKPAIQTLNYIYAGLPTETDEDILGIAEIANRINEIYYRKRRNRALSINLSTAMFVPKPLTPFQWVEQISIDEMLRKQILLRNELKRIKGVKYNWHTAEVSKLEGVFARGGRELSYVIENAYNNGCRFDGWDEHFNYDLWLKAFESTGLDMESYSRQRDLEERLPWDFIDFGVKKSYLIKEYKKAMQGLTTPSCKNECQMC